MEFSLRHPNLTRFHGGLDENQVERLFNTNGFHGKGLLFFLYSFNRVNLAIWRLFYLCSEIRLRQKHGILEKLIKFVLYSLSLSFSGEEQ